MPGIGLPSSPDAVSLGARQSRTRERLLDAMVEEAAQLGYSGLRVAGVCGRAGVSRTCLYEHFGDLEGCFIAALEREASRLLEEIEDAAGELGTKDVGRAVLGVLVGFSLRSQAAARLLFIESLAGGPLALDVRDRLRDQTAAIIECDWAKHSPEGPLLDAGAEPMTGGVFRLLSMRLRRGESGLERLPAELPLWVNSYLIPHGPPRWGDLRMEAGTPPAAVSTSMSQPRPLPPGRQRLSKAEVGRSQRERIMAAVVKLSYENGYEAVSIDQITAVARVSRNAFYAHFRDKSHAASEAHEQFFGEAMSACASAFFAATEWPERVWEGGGCWWRSSPSVPATPGSALSRRTRSGRRRSSRPMTG